VEKTESDDQNETMIEIEDGTRTFKTIALQMSRVVKAMIEKESETETTPKEKYVTLIKITIDLIVEYMTLERHMKAITTSFDPAIKIRSE